MKKLIFVQKLVQIPQFWDSAGGFSVLQLLKWAKILERLVNVLAVCCLYFMSVTVSMSILRNPSLFHKYNLGMCKIKPYYMCHIQVRGWPLLRAAPAMTRQTTARRRTATIPPTWRAARNPAKNVMVSQCRQKTRMRIKMKLSQSLCL